MKRLMYALTLLAGTHLAVDIMPTMANEDRWPPREPIQFWAPPPPDYYGGPPPPHFYPHGDDGYLVPYPQYAPPYGEIDPDRWQRGRRGEFRLQRRYNGPPGRFMDYEEGW